MQVSEIELMQIFGKLDDKQIMGLTIYGEARGEPDEGKIAVGSVILERVDKKSWMGKSIQEVCLKPYQFSCYLPNDPNFPQLKNIANDWDNQYNISQVLQNCYGIASGLIDGSIPRTPEIAEAHAYQYLTVALLNSPNCPSWVKSMKEVCRVGAQVFFA